MIDGDGDLLFVRNGADLLVHPADHARYGGTVVRVLADELIDAWSRFARVVRAADAAYVAGAPDAYRWEWSEVDHPVPHPTEFAERIYREHRACLEPHLANERP